MWVHPKGGRKADVGVVVVLSSSSEEQACVCGICCARLLSLSSGRNRCQETVTFPGAANKINGRESYG